MKKHEIEIQSVSESVSEKNGKTYYNMLVMTEVARVGARSKYMTKAQQEALGGNDFDPQQRWAFFNVCEDELVGDAPDAGDLLGDITGKDYSILTVHITESEYNELVASDEATGGAEALPFSEYLHGGTLEPMTKDGEPLYKANFVEFSEDAEDVLIKADKQEVEEKPKAKAKAKRRKAKA